MKPMLKKALYSTLGLVIIAAAGLGAYVYAQVRAFDESVARVYEVPVLEVQASNSPEVVERGKHLAHSMGGCALSDCHGSNLGGGNHTKMGPVGELGAPNITSGGMGAVYSDGELMRLIEHGIKKNGRSVLFMTSHEINWLPQTDILAIISYIRSLPAVDAPGHSSKVGVLGKVLDRRGEFAWDIARRIDHDHLDKAPPPTPTAEYGRHIAKLCMGCHGETFAGGPLPGAPPDIPVPANITPHETGLPNYTYEQFEALADRATTQKGVPVDPFMPTAALSNMNELERKALYAFLVSLPPQPFGNR